MKFISEGIFEKYSKMKILVLTFLNKDQILRPFSGLAPSKLKMFSTKFNGSICAYRVLHLPFLRELKVVGGGDGIPTPVLPVLKVSKKNAFLRELIITNGKALNLLFSSIFV